jgi:ABC-type multidrug transport system permease subunit
VTTHRGAAGESEEGPAALDDQLDRAELRNRYYGLLQELRVVVTGVQVLLAFLLTVPFDARFAELTDVEQAWFGAALVCATLSVIAFVSPTAMHRFGKRTARGERLASSIVATRLGLLLLGLSVLISFAVVVGFLYHGVVPVVLVAGVAAVMVAFWVVLPVVTRVRDRD